MQHPPETASAISRVWHDLGTFIVLGLVVVPLYLMLNHYWQSLVLLVVCYGVLCLFCLRLGGYTRRVMRRLPAEIPPWHLGFVSLQLPLGVERRWSTADAVQSVRTDPHYVQEVLKPRLRQWVTYRLTGMLDLPFEALDAAQLTSLDPRLLAFLQRQELTSLWARYSQRQQRVDTVLDMCQRLEGV
jgi:cell division protein FtsW (lipid II flippase)